jgi:hypothetical protein
MFTIVELLQDLLLRGYSDNIQGGVSHASMLVLRDVWDDSRCDLNDIHFKCFCTRQKGLPMRNTPDELVVGSPQEHSLSLATTYALSFSHQQGVGMLFGLTTSCYERTLPQTIHHACHLQLDGFCFYHGCQIQFDTLCMNPLLLPLLWSLSQSSSSSGRHLGSEFWPQNLGGGLNSSSSTSPFGQPGYHVNSFQGTLSSASSSS